MNTPKACCGKTYPPEAVHCAKCGNPLRASGMHRVGNFLVAFAALIVIGTAVHHCSTHEPESKYPHGFDMYPDGTIIPRPAPTRPYP